MSGTKLHFKARTHDEATEGMVMLALKSPKERNFLLKLESRAPQEVDSRSKMVQVVLFGPVK